MATNRIPKWKRRLWPMKENPEGLRFSLSNKRFEVVAAGRRSGKSERAKRKFIKRVMMGSDDLDPRYGACAPTQKQAKKIFWQDFKSMIPPQLLSGKPNESELEIKLINGATIYIAGLDNPARIEGSPNSGFLFDETDDIKRSAWDEHVEPCLLDRDAWAMYTGVPNGLAYLYELSKMPLKMADLWDFFTWKSSEVFSEEKLQIFKNKMDERSFKQEFEASFLNFTGLVYYNFSRDNYKHELTYNPNKPLIFCFDFNSSPGVAAVCQEQLMPGQYEQVLINGIWQKQPVMGTGIIGEVWIPRDSNTEIVCRRLYNDWKDHQGQIICYGDAAGGNKTSSGIRGSDWDIIKNYFKQTPFCGRISYKVPRSNPRIRARINAMTARIKSINGTIRLMVDAEMAPHVIDDFERTTVLEGGSGEIDKKKNPELTHLGDSLGYYIHREYPVENMKATSKEFLL